MFLTANYTLKENHIQMPPYGLFTFYFMYNYMLVTLSRQLLIVCFIHCKKTMNACPKQK